MEERATQIADDYKASPAFELRLPRIPLRHIKSDSLTASRGGPYAFPDHNLSSIEVHDAVRRMMFLHLPKTLLLWRLLQLPI